MFLTLQLLTKTVFRLKGDLSQKEVMMAILELAQEKTVEGKYEIRARLKRAGHGTLRRKAQEVEFELTAQDRSDLRWYLEDYLDNPFDPNPQIAARVEGRMEEIGSALFREIFEANEGMKEVWADVRRRLNETRVEIHTEVAEATAIPWELLYAPQLDNYVALGTAAFVRSYEEARQVPRLPETKAGEPIRILLAICRPKGKKDVPFRSVASRLVKGLKAEASQQVQLDVLRPPTFEQLGKVLQMAQRQGKPYHVLHFDGHGAYIEIKDQHQQAKALAEQLAGLLDGMSSDFFRAPRTGKHGYLLFEDPKEKLNTKLVDGRELGQLLVRSNVPVLVLNACRSAHADLPDDDLDTTSRASKPSKGTASSVSTAYGSLAQEVMEQGVAEVVAMRYNLHVVTATRLVAGLYEALVQGQTLGAAVTYSRQQLALEPTREAIYGPLKLQDWSVPVVYEAAPINLFPPPLNPPQFWEGDPSLWTINLSATSKASSTDLPPAPDAGFFGRDETLLALDRAFDSEQIVLLHAYAGSGKTTTAAEFARWYKQTGGVNGPILFTSFEQYQPLPRVLDKLEPFFGPILQQQDIHWLALTDAERRNVALQLLQQIPVLWIWDNVEPVAGFPTGTPSKWTATEQRELVDFLSAARDSKAKFLLTSRRDEQGWLSGLPCRIKVPKMRKQDRALLAKALASKHGRHLTHDDWKAWQSLLSFTKGNPLTLTVVVKQALRDNLRTKDQINAYVAQLRAGEAVFTDDESQGRSKSLGASLSYGFAHAFSEAERQQLALLHLFQGFVDPYLLEWMGDPNNEWHLPTIRGLTRQAAINLLNPAAEIGLLTPLGGGFYRIHPALPWFFKSLFDQYYGSSSDSFLKALRAFVEAMGISAESYARQYVMGNPDVIANLSFEEANLLYARQLARSHSWYHPLIGTMQGLHVLYDQLGRRTSWKRLVIEIVPDFVNLTSDGPLPGREEEWGFINDYRVRLARERRQSEEAERLQRLSVEWNRQRAANALRTAKLDSSQHNAIRTLAVSLEELGNIQRDQGQASCVAVYKEAISLCQRIGDKPQEAIIAHNLGYAYYLSSAWRNLAEAEQWYLRSYKLRDEKNYQGQAISLEALGNINYERSKKAHANQQPEAKVLCYLYAAFNYYEQALVLTPPHTINNLAAIHNQLGLIYYHIGWLDCALDHYSKSIRYKEEADNFYEAGLTRENVAIALKQGGRLQDARAYALAAIQDFQRYGAVVGAAIQKAERTLAIIEEEMKSHKGVT